MTVASAVLRVFFVGTLLVLSACSSISEEELFGYEDDFNIPEPDMVPVTPDDKPGRTVDEMLSLPSEGVTVKKAKTDMKEKPQTFYERAGRFGSKEKISLRKGLNAPDTGLRYSSETRKPAQTVRPLDLKEKDQLLTVSEEEMLAEIIAPKTEKTQEIEVVGINEEKDARKTDRLRQPSVKRSVAVFSVPLQSINVEGSVEPEKDNRNDAQEKTDRIILIPPGQDQTDRFNVEPLSESVQMIDLMPPVRLKPSSVSGTIILTPPDMTDMQETDSSVELFLE